MKTNIKTWLLNQQNGIKICMCLMLVFGIVMSFLIPPWQTPDEANHLTMVGIGIKNDGLAAVLQGDMDLEGARISFHYEEKLNIEQWRTALNQKPEYDWKDCMPRGIHPSVVKHLPATIGIVLGALLRLPTFWVLELGELFSLVFYVMVCWFAVKLMPIKKEVLLMFMIFPMTLQQASSISYDAVLIPVCFLFVAYSFYMRHTKERLGWKELLFTVGLLLLITYIKLPYLFLGLLVFLLPKEKIRLKIGAFEINGEVIHRFRIPVGIGLVALAVIGIYLLRGNFWIQLVGGMAMEWKRSGYLFLKTGYTFWQFLITSSVGQFGWLDSALPFAFTVLTYVLILVLGAWGKPAQVSHPMKGKTKVYIWGVFLLLSCLTVISMVNHTVKIILYGSEWADVTYNVREVLYVIPYIGGLQGRYFLPFLALPFVALPQRGRERDWKIWLVAGYFVAAMVLTIRVLYLRYWI